MSKASREKGKRGEREVVRAFAEVFGADKVRRGYQYRDGGEAPDVVCPIFHVESKIGARPNLLAALEQAEGDARPGVIPIAVCRRDRDTATVTLRLSDFLEVVSLWLAETGGDCCGIDRAEAVIAATRGGPAR